MEGSAYDLTHMTFLGHYRPQAEEEEEEEAEAEAEAVCGCCNESGSGGSQRNHHPAQSDTHTHLRIPKPFLSYKESRQGKCVFPNRFAARWK